MNKMNPESVAGEASESQGLKGMLLNKVERGIFGLMVNRPKTLNALNREILE